MDRGLKQILWMSWSLRSRALCSNYTISSRITQNISQSYWTTHKDIYWSERLEPVKKIMQESERHSSKDSIRILNTITHKRINMDLKDTLDVLTALAKIAKEDRDKVDFMNHEGFTILCEQLKNQIRVMNLPEVIESIKLLTFLNVPASTVLMQSLLQIVRNSINDLHMDQLHLLLCLLKKMEHTSLSSALLIALPILIPNIIETKLNREDLHELSLALFHLRNMEHKDLINNICKSIQSVIKENPKNVSIYIVRNIFNSLCFMSQRKYDSSIISDTIETLQEVLFHRAHKLSSLDLAECIHAVSYSVMNGNMTPYSTTLLNTLLEVVMSKNVEFYIGCKILKYLNNIQFIYVPFIEHLLHRTLPENISSENLIILLNALSNANYKSIPWDYIERKILDVTFLSNCNIRCLLDCSIYLASIDKYYSQLLSIIFIKIHLKILMTSMDKIHSEKLLLLYQSSKTLYREYKGPWPSNDTLTYLFKILYFPNRSLLRNQLQVAVGGPQYVLSSLTTKLGHYVDHAIIMRKGGYPIAFNTNNSNDLVNYSTCIEELQCPPESYVILILEFPPYAYSINTFRLLNVWKLQLNTLEKLTGHKCIDINLGNWKSLPNHEKTPYLMQKIRNECDDIVPEM